jgi:hypothetical protein
MPIYVAREPPKFKIPKDWDGSSAKWPIFKHKTEMACQSLNMSFLTSSLTTEQGMEEQSKKFAEALHEVVPHTAMTDFLGANRQFYRTKGIEMYQRLCEIHEPTHATAITAILEQLSTIRMDMKETPSAYKLRVELLNERLPREVAYAPALLAHVAYKGLDANRYGDFQKNVRAGNKNVETITGLFSDIECYDNLSVGNTVDTSTTSILKNASARTVSFEKTTDKAKTSKSSEESDSTFGWKGQQDLNEKQATFLLTNKYKKGCPLCRTGTHEFVACPVVKETSMYTIKRNSKTTRPSETGSARVTTSTIQDDDNLTTSDSTADEQGKFDSTSYVSTLVSTEISLSPSTASNQYLTSSFHSSQDELDSDDTDQLGSFQQEIFHGPKDPSISNTMRIRRDNASRVVVGQTASTTFGRPTGPCMGRAKTTSICKIIKSGFACVDSGATHDMSNGVETDFKAYRKLPKGSHVLVADNHAIPCLGIGIQYMKINNKIIERKQVLHVPDLKAPLISVRQHRRRQGCSFLADNAGCYLTFPEFSLTVDDNVDCLVSYETIAPNDFDISCCDYLQPESQKIEELAIFETRKFENERKARSSSHQTAPPIIQWGRGMQRRIQKSPNITHGLAWQVDTRASIRRQQEQTAQHIEADTKAKQAKIELQRLTKEAKQMQETLQSSKPQTVLTPDEKQQLIASIIDSLEQHQVVDYKLIRETDRKYPEPVQDQLPTDGIQKPNSPSFSKTGKRIPTTTTPEDRPDSLPCDKPPSASPSIQRFNEQQLHRYFGFRHLKNWLDLENTGQETIKVIKGNERPMELGDVANIRYSRRNTTPIPRPAEYLRTVHMDIGYGDCVSIGGFRYVLLLVDRATRFQWIYGLRTMTQDNIIAALEKFHADAGGLPHKIYTDFDPKLMAGDTEQWLLTKIPDQPCRVSAAPSGRQNENGLVERAWQTTVNMARAYITDMQMPRSYWFWALRHANQVANYIPCKVNDELTTPFELVYGVKPDYRILFRLFSTVY